MTGNAGLGGFVESAGVIPPSALPGISPTGGEIGWAAPLAPRSTSTKAAPRVDLPPCGGDARQGRGGSATPANLTFVDSTYTGPTTTSLTPSIPSVIPQ